MWWFWSIQSIWAAEDFCQSDSSEIVHSIQVIQEVLNTKDCAHTLQKLKKVESLLLIDQGLTDVSVLTVAENLKYVNLRQNHLQQFNAGNSALQWVDLSYNPIVSIKSTSVKTIYCNHCQLQSLEQIQAPKVKELILRNNQISEIVLKDFSKLSVLLLSNNQISDINPLISSKQLKVLDLSLNGIEKDDCPTDKTVGKGLRIACGALYE